MTCGEPVRVPIAQTDLGKDGSEFLDILTTYANCAEWVVPHKFKHSILARDR